MSRHDPDTPLPQRVERRDRAMQIVIALLAVVLAAVTTLATCIYSQGSAAGATSVRVEALETRTREDRALAAERAERQRQQDALEAQRHTELLQALHAIDARLGRLEERQTPRR